MPGCSDLCQAKHGAGFLKQGIRRSGFITTVRGKHRHGYGGSGGDAILPEEKVYCVATSVCRHDALTLADPVFQPSAPAIKNVGRTPTFAHHEDRRLPSRPRRHRRRLCSFPALSFWRCYVSFHYLVEVFRMILGRRPKYPLVVPALGWPSESPSGLVEDVRWRTED